MGSSSSMCLVLVLSMHVLCVIGSLRNDRSGEYVSIKANLSGDVEFRCSYERSFDAAKALSQWNLARLELYGSAEDDHSLSFVNQGTGPVPKDTIVDRLTSHHRKHSETEVVQYSPQEKEHIQSVFNTSHGVSLFNISGILVSYLRVYKCANDNIRANLALLEHRSEVEKSSLSAAPSISKAQFAQQATEWNASSADAGIAGAAVAPPIVVQSREFRRTHNFNFVKTASDKERYLQRLHEFGIHDANLIRWNASHPPPSPPFSPLSRSENSLLFQSGKSEKSPETVVQVSDLSGRSNENNNNNIRRGRSQQVMENSSAAEFERDNVEFVDSEVRLKQSAIDAKTSKGSIRTFTFVRDPIAHFKSGFQEMLWRQDRDRHVERVLNEYRELQKCCRAAGKGISSRRNPELVAEARRHSTHTAASSRKDNEAPEEEPSLFSSLLLASSAAGERRRVNASTSAVDFSTVESSSAAAKSSEGFDAEIRIESGTGTENVGEIAECDCERAEAFNESALLREAYENTNFTFPPVQYTLQAIRERLRHLFTIEGITQPHVAHVFPIAGVLRAADLYNLQFVGKLENFKEDWKYVISLIDQHQQSLAAVGTESKRISRDKQQLQQQPLQEKVETERDGRKERSEHIDIDQALSLRGAETASVAAAAARSNTSSLGNPHRYQPESEAGQRNYLRLVPSLDVLPSARGETEEFLREGVNSSFSYLQQQQQSHIDNGYSAHDRHNQSNIDINTDTDASVELAEALNDRAAVYDHHYHYQQQQHRSASEEDESRYAVQHLHQRSSLREYEYDYKVAEHAASSRYGIAALLSEIFRAASTSSASNPHTSSTATDAKSRGDERVTEAGARLNHLLADAYGASDTNIVNTDAAAAAVSRETKNLFYSDDDAHRSLRLTPHSLSSSSAITAAVTAAAIAAGAESDAHAAAAADALISSARVSLEGINHTFIHGYQHGGGDSVGLHVAHDSTKTTSSSSTASTITSNNSGSSRREKDSENADREREGVTLQEVVRHDQAQEHREHVRIVRAICRLKMMDFVCFGYTLPPVCADMQP